jgi:signal transduction histidine kinase
MAKRIFPRSIRSRLTVIATLIAAMVFTTTSVISLATLPGNLRGAVQNRVELAVRRVASEARTGQLTSVIETPPRVPILQVITPDGGVLAASENARDKGPLTALRTDKPETVYSSERVLDGPSDILEPGAQYLVMAMRVLTPRGYVTVYAAASLSDVNRALSWMYVLIFGGTPLVLIIVASLSWAVVGQALRPVERIRAELAEITGHDLSRRVPVPDTGDEITDLAATTNHTLDRLERSAETQRRFVADASHELRSPITALRAQLEVATAYPDETDWASTGASALSSADRLTDIIDELLMLARLDAGAIIDRRVVDIADLAEEQVRRRAGGPVHIVPDIVERACVLGSSVQLDRVLTNLLDNATRHAHSRIGLQVAVDEKDVVVTVTDDGTGILPEYRECVFERFTRLPEARAKDKGGSGLGLALSREIAIAHRGNLTITDHYPGAQFVLRLPLHLEDQPPT